MHNGEEFNKMESLCSKAKSIFIWSIFAWDGTTQLYLADKRFPAANPAVIDALMFV